jgi:hypothetical protein
MHDEIISKLSKLEEVIAQFDDVIGKEAEELRKNDKYKLKSADKIQEEIDYLSEDERLLSIGIIGVVKAGKSSLLNSIFFNGNPILPKAATPMTASLSILTYGDPPPSATVEYFTKQDIDVIKKEHEAYQAEWNNKKKENERKAQERAKKTGEVPDLEVIERNTNRDMENSPKLASYEQLELMSKAEKPNQENQKLNANSIEELLGKLEPYVGSKGRMMPYTKSIEIFLPEDELRGIRVVDTPGMNDPVRSREERTEEYLSKCDVVFIISQASSFFTSYEKDLIGLLFNRNNIGQIFIIASQYDRALYDGSVPKKAGGNLNEAIKNTKKSLFPKAKEAFKELQDEYSRIARTLSQPSDERADLVNNNLNGAGQFDQLLKGDEECFLYCSSICNDILLKYDKRDSWDGTMKLAWELLNKYYPSHFDSEMTEKANLEILSNINAVKEKIRFAQNHKNEINESNRLRKINGLKNQIDNFSIDLMRKIEGKHNTVKNTSLTEIMDQRKKIENLLSKRSEAVDSAFEDCVTVFKENIREEILKKTNDAFANVDIQIVKSGGTLTKTGTRYTGPCCFETAESYNYEVRTLQTSIVKSTLNELVSGAQELFEISFESTKKTFKDNILSKVTKALREEEGDDPDSSIRTLLRTSLRQIVYNIDLPNLDLGTNKFSSSFSGVVENENADRFLDEVREYTSGLKDVVVKARRNVLSHIDKSLKQVKISELITADLKERIDEITGNIKEKELTLERLEKCINILRGVT